MNIIVNCREKEYNGEIISYEQVMQLAGHDPEKVYSVTWSDRKEDRNGLMYKGKIVPVNEGMVFNAMDTSNA